MSTYAPDAQGGPGRSQIHSHGHHEGDPDRSRAIGCPKPRLSSVNGRGVNREGGLRGGSHFVGARARETVQTGWKRRNTQMRNGGEDRQTDRTICKPECVVQSRPLSVPLPNTRSTDQPTDRAHRARKHVWRPGGSSPACVHTSLASAAATQSLHTYPGLLGSLGTYASKSQWGSSPASTEGSRAGGQPRRPCQLANEPLSFSVNFGDTPSRYPSHPINPWTPCVPLGAATVKYCLLRRLPLAVGGRAGASCAERRRTLTTGAQATVQTNCPWGKPQSVLGASVWYACQGEMQRRRHPMAPPPSPSTPRVSSLSPSLGRSSACVALGSRPPSFAPHFQLVAGKHCFAPCPEPPVLFWCRSHDGTYRRTHTRWVGR